METIQQKSSLAQRIYKVLKTKGEPMSIKEIHAHINDKPETTVRGRIYDNIGKLFKKIARGVYFVENEEAACVVIQADGRTEGLQMLDNASVDCIVTDHPWEVSKSNKGGNRDFTSDYNCFRYTLEDFQEKARVLKDGAFLVEVVPTESAENYEYLYDIKQMAKQAGFSYYAKVPWKKGDFVANIGRTQKNTEDVLVFYKGTKCRALRPDKKKMLQGIENAKMAGAAFMLPTVFDYQPPSKAERIHQAEKPVDLLVKILEAFTLPGEIVVDQFAGSGVLGAAALKMKNRIAILFEDLRENVEKIAYRLNATAILKDGDFLIKDEPTFTTMHYRKDKKANVEFYQSELELF